MRCKIHYTRFYQYLTAKHFKSDMHFTYHPWDSALENHHISILLPLCTSRHWVFIANSSLQKSSRSVISVNHNLYFQFKVFCIVLKVSSIPTVSPQLHDTTTVFHHEADVFGLLCSVSLPQLLGQNHQLCFLNGTRYPASTCWPCLFTYQLTDEEN